MIFDNWGSVVRSREHVTENAPNLVLFDLVLQKTKKQKEMQQNAKRIQTANSDSKGSSMATKVYVGNLSRDADERDIEDIFQKFGRIDKIWIARNPPGFAFVDYEV